MANEFTVNLYERSVVGGVNGIRPIADGLGQAEITGVKENVTVVYALGQASNEENVFEVKMNGTRSFITDSAGWLDLDVNRLNKYTRTLQPAGTDFEGEYKYQYFGFRALSSVRVKVPNIATIVSLQQTGVDVDGVETETCYKVTMIDGESFVTDASGKTIIDNWF